MPAIVKTLTVVSTTNGVATQVSDVSLLVSSAIFQAGALNTGKVYFGASNVTTSNGIALSAGESLELTFDNQYGNNNIIDLSTVYFESDTTGNTVRVSYIKWLTPNNLTV